LDYVHSSTPAAASFLCMYCVSQGWDVIVSDDNKLLEKSSDSVWDVIVLLNNSGEIFDPKLEALSSHIEAGRGVLGVHAALACFLNGKDAVGGTLMDPTCNIIEETFGAHFRNHPVPQTGTVTVDQEAIANFEELKNLPLSFEHHDEFFNFNKNPCDNEDIIPLLYVDESSYEGGLMGEQKHPVVWYQHKGANKAPIFYCALGHFTHFYNSTGPREVQTILKAALQFVVGK